MGPSRLQVGCNYHTTWQSNKAMRFVLVEVKGLRAKLKTRVTRKVFWCDIADLIFIDSKHNQKKADRLKAEAREKRIARGVGF